MRTCIKCQKEIPISRLEILPETEHCTMCSVTKKVVARNIYSHKTGFDTFIVPGDDKNKVHMLMREYNRGR
jgi:hypothetical protein